jgi:hypothetical protein
MTYRDLVSRHLQTLTDSGLTQLEIARLIGLKTGNLVCMHIKQIASPLPLKRLPALAKLCKLDAYESIRMVHARAKYCPDNPTEMDVDTLKWVLGCAAQASRIVKEKRPAGGAVRGC